MFSRIKANLKATPFEDAILLPSSGDLKQGIVKMENLHKLENN